jgi:hypothetical protein
MLIKLISLIKIGTSSKYNNRYYAKLNLLYNIKNKKINLLINAYKMLKK